MEKDRRRVVHGSYDNQEELIEEIRRLQEQGYRKEDIVVYSSGSGRDTDDPIPSDLDDAISDPQKRAPGSTEGAPDTTDGISDPRKRAPGSEGGVGDLTDAMTEPRKRAPGPTGVEDGHRVPDKGDDLTDADVDRQKKAPGSTGHEGDGTDVSRTDRDTDDKSAWDKVKDFFSTDTYNHDEVSQNPNYRTENDILYPHREDLTRGNRIIVLNRPNDEETRINI